MSFSVSVDGACSEKKIHYLYNVCALSAQERVSLFAGDQIEFASSVSRLAHCNPFLPERIECERAALGSEFVDDGPVWYARDDREIHPNVERIGRRIEPLIQSARAALVESERAGVEQLRLYRGVVLYWLYDRYQERMLRLFAAAADPTRRVPFYRDFAADCRRYLEPAAEGASGFDAAHLFACFFQVRRAFDLVFRHILGSSMPIARLRASVWQSIFTRDIERYRRSLFDRMGDVTTLVTGPTGTGKELVARAVGLARFIPFDPQREAFSEDSEASFFALNLSALSPTLIESELFGHRRGAFTGAVADRVGWLEACPALGTVFLDEIGEVDPAIQVKLLRVLQTRVFQPLGDTTDRTFEGKIIAATNRDPAREMRGGRMREDLYYRLCSDLITTPTLAEQVRGAPEELGHLVGSLVRRMVGEEDAAALTTEVMQWIGEALGPDYSWPGNVRELEQCVRNVMIRGAYHPQRAPSDPAGELAEQVAAGSLTADGLLRRYVTLAYAREGSYQGAARRLQLDRRTVKAKIDPELLSSLRDG